MLSVSEKTKGFSSAIFEPFRQVFQGFVVCLLFKAKVHCDLAALTNFFAMEELIRERDEVQLVDFDPYWAAILFYNF